MPFSTIQVEHPTNKAIICDLGVGKLMDATLKTCAGGNADTLAYQHKEQLLDKAPSQAGDVYSFAVVMVEVYTQVPVWKGLSLVQLQKTIMDDVYPAYDSTDIPAKAKDMSDGLNFSICLRCLIFLYIDFQSLRSNSHRRIFFCRFQLLFHFLVEQKILGSGCMQLI